MFEVNIIASGSSGNCYIISDGKTKVMIDPGIPGNQIIKKTKHKVTECECCLVSHEHGDHVRGAGTISRYIPIAATPETLNEIQHKQLIMMSKTLKKNVHNVFNTLAIVPFEVKHNAIDPVCFHITSLEWLSSLVFVTDSQYLKYKFPERTKYMVIECNYDEEILTENVVYGKIKGWLADKIRANHYSVETLIKTLKTNTQVEKLWLIHNSTENLDIQSTIEQIQEVYKNDIYTYQKEMGNEDTNHKR